MKSVKSDSMLAFTFRTFIMYFATVWICCESEYWFIWTPVLAGRYAVYVKLTLIHENANYKSINITQNKTHRYPKYTVTLNHSRHI